MRALFEGVLRWDDEIALAPPKGSKPSAPTDMYAYGTSGVPFFDVLRYQPPPAGADRPFSPNACRCCSR